MFNAYSIRQYGEILQEIEISSSVTSEFLSSTGHAYSWLLLFSEFFHTSVS